MDKKTTYILIAVVAIVVIAGVIIAVSSMNNNDNGSGSSEERTITYHGNGGTHGSLDTYETTSSTIPYITWDRAGYKAVGYTESSDGTGTVYKYEDAVPKVNDLYVKWDKLKTTVNFSGLPDGLKITANGTDITTSGQSVETDEKGKVTICVMNTATPGKYTFESGIEEPYINKYIVKEGDTEKYSITCKKETSLSDTGYKEKITLDEVLTYEFKNYETVTLTFTAIEPK